MKTIKLTSMFEIKHPVIQASMYLVSNIDMVIEVMKSGITR